MYRRATDRLLIVPVSRFMVRVSSQRLFLNGADVLDIIEPYNYCLPPRENEFISRESDGMEHVLFELNRYSDTRPLFSQLYRTVLALCCLGSLHIAT